MFKRVLFFAMVLVMISAVANAAPRLALGSATESSDSVVIPLIFISDKSSGVAALGIDISYAADALEVPSVEIGPSASAAGKNISLSNPSTGIASLGFFGFNTTAIGDGVVAVLTFRKKMAVINEKLNFGYSSYGANSEGDDVVMDKSDTILTVE